MPVDPNLLEAVRTIIREEVGSAPAPTPEWLSVESSAAYCELVESVASPGTAPEMAKIICDNARKRDLIHLHFDGLKDCYDGRIDHQEALRRAQEGMACVVEMTEGPNDRKFSKIDAVDFLGMEFKTTFAIDGVLVEGQPLIIGGASKTLKTCLMIDAVVSLASGADFLGQYPVRQRYRVGMMSGESGPATIQETIRRVCAAKGISPDFLKDKLFITEELPRFDRLVDLRALTEFADGLEWVFIDPAYLCAPSDGAGNFMSQGEMLSSVHQAIREGGAELGLAHHANRHRARTKPNSPPTLDDLAWAGYAEFFRQWWLLGRRSEQCWPCPVIGA